MSDRVIEIGGRKIGDGQPCFVIGEAGLNHNGDLEIAKKLIDSAADAGCDCVKFQRRTVEVLATRDILDAKDDRFPSLGATYREIRERHEFSAGQFQELVNHAKARGIMILCTPFDGAAVEFLEQFDLPGYKIASHSVTNLPLLERLAETGKPMIMSTGMCTLEELDQALGIFAKAGTPVAILHCVSAYPTPPEAQNMAMIGKLRERYAVPVGYSGHEIGFQPTLLSIALRASIVERHITLDTGMEGFDHKLSLSPKMLAEMVENIRLTETMMGTGEKRVSETEQITRNKYHVSVVSARAISAGEALTPEMVTFKNPGTGIPPSRLSELVGKVAARDIGEDTMISRDMFEG